MTCGEVESMFCCRCDDVDAVRETTHFCSLNDLRLLIPETSPVSGKRHDGKRTIPSCHASLATLSLDHISAAAATNLLDQQAGFSGGASLRIDQ